MSFGLTFLGAETLKAPDEAVRTEEGIFGTGFAERERLTYHETFRQPNHLGVTRANRTNGIIVDGAP